MRRAQVVGEAAAVVQHAVVAGVRARRAQHARVQLRQLRVQLGQRPVAQRLFLVHGHQLLHDLHRQLPLVPAVQQLRDLVVQHLLRGAFSSLYCVLFLRLEGNKFH